AKFEAHEKNERIDILKQSWDDYVASTPGTDDSEVAYAFLLPTIQSYVMRRGLEDYVEHVYREVREAAGAALFTRLSNEDPTKYPKGMHEINVLVHQCAELMLQPNFYYPDWLALHSKILALLPKVQAATANYLKELRKQYLATMAW